MKISINQRSLISVKRIQKRLSAPALFTILLLLIILHATPKFFKSQDFRERSQEIQFSNKSLKSTTRKVLILSSYRSGSSLMGELVASTSVRTMYDFEPTYKAFLKDAAKNRTRGQSQFCGDIIRSILSCGEIEQNYGKVTNYRYFQSTSHKVMKIFNTDWIDFSWDSYPTNPEERIKYTEYICTHSTMKLIKTIRLPVLEYSEMFHELYTLMEEFPDLVIIGEIRDPRDAYASRKKFGGGPGFENDHLNLEFICKNYSSIIQFLEAVSRGPHGSRVAIVKYEDLYFNPITVIKDTFARLALPMTDRTIKYIKTNIMNEKGGDSKETSEHGFFTKPRDQNSTIGYWKKANMDPRILEKSADCIREYEDTKTTVLN